MNNRRKLKPQVKVVLIVLGVFFGFIILENLIGGISAFIKNTKSKIEYNQKHEVQQQDPEYQEGQAISEFVAEMMAYLSEGKYEEVYKVTDPEYIEALNIDSVDKFKTIIDEYLGQIPKNVKLEDYIKTNDRYVCEISVEKDDVIEIIQVMVKPREDDNYYIIIDDLASIEKYNKQFRFSNSEFEYDIKYKVKKNKEEILVIEAQNKTSNTLVASYDSSVLVKSSQEECALKNIEEVQNIEFPAGSTIKFSLVFPNDKYAAYPDEALKLRVQFDNGTKIDRRISMFLANDY